MTGVELHVLTDWLMSTTNALAAGDPYADLSRRCLAAALARLRGSWGARRSASAVRRHPAPSWKCATLL